MAGKSDYLEDKLNDHGNGKASYTMPSVWVGLYSAAPSDAGGGTQLTGAGGYARQPVTFTASSGGSASNDSILVFGPATGSDWAAATHFATFDAATAGNMLKWAALTTPRTAEVGNRIEFAIGALVLTED